MHFLPGFVKSSMQSFSLVLLSAMPGRQTIERTNGAGHPLWGQGGELDKTTKLRLD